jgi:hypothetical protein
MSTLPLQITFWIDYKSTSPLERGEGEGEGLKKGCPPHPGPLPPVGGEGDFLGGLSGLLSRSGIPDTQAIKVLATIGNFPPDSTDFRCIIFTIS